MRRVIVISDDTPAKTNTIHCLARTAIVAVALIAPPAAHAAGWRITPNASLGVIYTDNIELVSTNKEDELITVLGVGFSASRSGGRLSADINYAQQGLIYSEDNDANELFHQLDAIATLEVSRDQFFIDATANIYQQVIDSRKGHAADLIPTSDNRGNVFTAGITPRLAQAIQIGRELQLRAAYNTAVVTEFDIDSDASIGDADSSTLTNATASLGNNVGENSTQWYLEYSQIRTDTDNGNDTRQEEASLNVFYPLTPTLKLVGVAGEERNTYERNVNSEDPNGPFWEAGIEWRVSPRDQLELRRGERFYGTTNTLRWNHLGRRFDANVSYNEDLTTTTQNLLNDDGSGTTRLSEETSISKQFDASMTYKLPKSRFTLNVFETRNEYQVSLEKDKTRGAGLTWEWNIASRTQLSANLALERAEFENPDQETEDQAFTLRMTRTISSATTSSVAYTHSQFDSDVKSDEYDTNIFYINFSHTF